MQHTVVYYIVSLLDKEDRVVLPGLGRFSRVVDGASVLEQAREVSPPSSTIRFDHDFDLDDQLLEKYIEYRTGLDAYSARAHISNFSESIKSALREGMPVEVQDFGTFRPVENGLSFDPAKDIANLAYLGLKNVPIPTKTPVSSGQSGAIPIVPVLREPVITETPEVSEEVPEQEKEERKRRVPLLIPLLLALFFVIAGAAVISYYFGDGNGKYPPEAFNRAPVLPTSDDTAASSADSADDHELSMSKEMAGVLLPDDARDDTSSAEDDTSAVTAPVIPTLSDSVTEEMADDTTELIEANGYSHSEGTNGESYETVDTTSAKSECFVVVGAFAVNSNATRMYDRLSTMGYAPSMMARGSLTQVGVGAPCNSREIRTMLEDLRMNVEGQAWIFKK